MFVGQEYSGVCTVSCFLCLIIFPLENLPTFTRFLYTSLLRATNQLSWKFRSPWVSIYARKPFSASHLLRLQLLWPLW
jgi:hypothetical protein